MSTPAVNFGVAPCRNSFNACESRQPHALSIYVAGGPMRIRTLLPWALLVIVIGIVVVAPLHAAPPALNWWDNAILNNDQILLNNGRQIFRFDTFGDEAFWTDALKMNQAIAGQNNGGVGPGVSPVTALAVGLKVDMDALPGDVVAKAKRGEVNLDDPATTLALIKLDAVLGVKGTFNSDGSLKALGLSCAVCHSTVDDAFMPVIGHRLDGW